MAPSPAGYWLGLVGMLLLALSQTSNHHTYSQALLTFALVLATVHGGLLVAYYRRRGAVRR